MLAGNQVFWPTYEYIYIFQQSSHQQVRQPIELSSLGLTGGNLVIDQDTLLIAGADRLTALNRWGSNAATGQGGQQDGVEEQREPVDKGVVLEGRDN